VTSSSFHSSVITMMHGSKNIKLLEDLKEKRGSGKIQRRRTTSHCV